MPNLSITSPAACQARPLRGRPGRWSSLRATLAAALLGLFAWPAANAHLMVAQHGTLNIVGNGAFMVLSLPVSSFTGVDDDGDGALSLAEMRAHAADIQAQVRRGAVLSDAQGARPLEGLMLNLSPPDDRPTAPASQLVVMGRFALDSQTDGLTFEVSLFGKGSAEQAQEITVSRGPEKQRMLLAPGRDQREILPAAWSVLVDHVALGAEHVLSGFDHLLFLLVVLATGWSLRQTVLALSCFTVGHFITLAGSAWLGWAVPASIVEPAIAATIVGLALFDRWSAGRAQPAPATLRLALIFGAALIHGLGFAGALTDLGLDSDHQLPSLAGFNIGIEAGQLAVALLATTLMAAITRLAGGRAMTLTTRLASYLGMVAGSVWLVQRVLVAV